MYKILFNFWFWLFNAAVLFLLPKSGNMEKVFSIRSYFLNDVNFHIGLFIILTITSLQTLGSLKTSDQVKVCFSLLGFGILIEFLQPLVMRSTQLSDIFLDLFGITLGLLGFHVFHYFNHRLCKGS